MKTVLRFDQGTLRKPETTPQGFLRVEGLAARAGVLEYRNPDGSVRRELRLREDVASPQSLAGYEGASLTDGHPTVMVSPDNVRTLEAGTVMSARMDGDWVVVPIVVKDKRLAEKIRSGKTGLSAGYTVRLDETPGMHPVYGRYDAIQRDITINHLAAAVEVPRAGDGARIRLDDMDMGGMDYAMADPPELIVMTTSVDGHQHTLELDDPSGCTSCATSEGADIPHKHEWIRTADGSITISENAGHTHAVDPVTLGVRSDAVLTAAVENKLAANRTDGQQIDQSNVVTEGSAMDKDEQIRLLTLQLKEAKQGLETATADLKVRTDERDAAVGKLSVAEHTAKETQARLDSGLAVAETEKVKEIQARLDEANGKLHELEKSIPDLVRKRASLVNRARAILGDDYRADSLDDRRILEAGVKRFDPKADTAKESIVGLQARFDAFYDSRAQSAASTARLSAALAVRADANQPTEIDPFDPLHNGAGQFASPHAAKRGA